MSFRNRDRHTSGFALRSPRTKRVRNDKTVQEIDTIEKVRTILKKREAEYPRRGCDE